MLPLMLPPPLLFRYAISYMPVRFDVDVAAFAGHRTPLSPLMPCHLRYRAIATLLSILRYAAMPLYVLPIY